MILAIGSNDLSHQGSVAEREVVQCINKVLEFAKNIFKSIAMIFAGLAILHLGFGYFSFSTDVAHLLLGSSIVSYVSVLFLSVFTSAMKKKNIYKVSGIENGGCNCWVNSLLQMINSCSDLKIAVGHNFTDFINFFKSYENSINDGKYVVDFDSQKIREFFARNHNLSSNIYDQEDASEALNLLVNSISRKEDFEVELITNRRCYVEEIDPKINVVRRKIFDRKPSIEKTSTVFSLPITKEKDFLKSLNKFLVDKNPEPYTVDGTKVIGETRKFKKAPKNLFFSLKRFAYQKASFIERLFGNSFSLNKIADSVDVPKVLKISKNFVNSRKDEIYRLKSFIIHIGSSIKRGHYISIVEKNGNWYECDDSHVRQIDQSELQNLMQKAYMFYFSKD